MVAQCEADVSDENAASPANLCVRAALHVSNTVKRPCTTDPVSPI